MNNRAVGGVVPVLTLSAELGTGGDQGHAWVGIVTHLPARQIKGVLETYPYDLPPCFLDGGLRPRRGPGLA